MRKKEPQRKHITKVKAEKNGYHTKDIDIDTFLRMVTMFLLIESPSVSTGDDSRTPQVSISQNAQVPYVNTASLYLKDYLLITCVYTTIYFKSSLDYLQYLYYAMLSHSVVSDSL